jgi:hypothetical protein
MATPDFSLVIQGSEEWKQIRCGIVTASRVADLFATKGKDAKKQWAASREKYRRELEAEMLTGIPTPCSAEFARQVAWGKEQEKFARAEYELERGVDVELCGFAMHPDIARFGCSPDGLVGDDGMIQIKCPLTTTHLDWLREGKVPVEHMPQMLAEMSCTGRDWCDFISYDPRLPKHLQLFVRRFERDQQFIDMLESGIVAFNTEIANSLAQLPGNGPQLVVNLLDQADADERDWY